MRPYPNGNSNPVYYSHVRYETKRDDGKIVNTGFTIAWREHENGLRLEVALARCNPNDNFNKKIGRSIALGNLNWDRLWLVDKPSEAKADHRRVVHEWVLSKVTNSKRT